MIPPFLLTLLIWVLLIVTTLTAVGLVALVIYARWHYGELESLGIPVVKPHWLLGSNWGGHKVIQHLEDIKRGQKYGRVYGVYEGRSPAVYICDPELVRIISTRDFDSFRNHRKVDLGHEVYNEMLDFLDDEKWKVVRSMLTPMFTTGKLKQLTSIVSEAAQEYSIALRKEHSGETTFKMDVRKYLPPLILECIGKCFCGIQVENARDPDNVFVKNMFVAMGADGFTFDWTFYFAQCFPFITKLMPMFPNDGLAYFTATMTSILDAREKSSGAGQNDMVQALMEARQKCRSDPEYKRLGIKETTILGQAFEFFIAAYFALLVTMTDLIHHLVVNPETLEKAFNEVDALVAKHKLDSPSSNGQVTHEMANDLPYLTACIKETFRYTPGFFRPDRLCQKDWEYEGIKIKKGMGVIFNMMAIHNNPDTYPNPDKFDPERFLNTDLNPYTLMTFGHGPRACIGQRFAYDMLRIVLATFMIQFRFQKRNDTEFKVKPGNWFTIEHEPIYVDFVVRDNIKK